MTALHSYKPPMAAGKLLYCLGRGHGYPLGASTLNNSYTYASATGGGRGYRAETALAQSGMGELDAQQLENFKWMMTFISDYKGDIPGSLLWLRRPMCGITRPSRVRAMVTSMAVVTPTLIPMKCTWLYRLDVEPESQGRRRIPEADRRVRCSGASSLPLSKMMLPNGRSTQSQCQGPTVFFFNYYAPRKLVTNASWR